MQNQVVKQNDISHIAGNINFNYYTIPKRFSHADKFRESIIQLLDQVKFLKQELRSSRKRNTELIKLLGTQTDRLIEKETEIRDLIRKFGNY
jgi:hypothetical protein